MWCARAPELEEDVALANIALDQLGAARLLLSYAGELEGSGGDGTDESHARMQAAVDEVWPYTHELLAETPHLERPWLSTVDSVLDEATLDRPADGWRPGGGRQGLHTEALSYLLAELQVLHRA